MDNWPCRYCGHLEDISKPREKYIGKCELDLHPETCGKFELAKCCEGHDPRQQNQCKTEKRKEYDEGDIISCPKCNGDDLDYEEAPGQGKCNSCGVEFQIKTVLIWKE
jgi:hypothetical protein